MPKIEISDGAHELALTIINTGEGYSQRLEFAAWALDKPGAPGVVRLMADRWAYVAREGARLYERQFGSPGASCFTVADILGAALELADYYEQHVRENRALAAAEAKGGN